MDLKKIDDIMGDTADAIVETVLENIPVVNLFASVAGKVKNSYLQRKFESWQEMVNARLSSLESDLVEKLGDNETFAVALMRATELAAQSNQKKMELLANFVRYTAENDIDDDLLIIYLNYISRYSVTHFLALWYFQKPPIPNDLKFTYTSTAMSEFIKHFPNVKGSVALVALKDLYNDGFMTTSDFVTNEQRDCCFARRTNDRGIDFIGVIGLNNMDMN